MSLIELPTPPRLLLRSCCTPPPRLPASAQLLASRTSASAPSLRFHLYLDRLFLSEIISSRDSGKSMGRGSCLARVSTFNNDAIGILRANSTGYTSRWNSKKLAMTLRYRSISAIANDEESLGSLRKQLTKLFEVSVRTTVPTNTNSEPLVDVCIGNFGDYQCNNAMSIWSRIKGNETEFRDPRAVGEALIKNLPRSEMIEKCTVAGPGFVNVVLSTSWISKSIQKMLTRGIGELAPRMSMKRVVVDFSSPNMAKEMHVGHLRSTIIGDTLARMLEFSNVEVLRRNHVGDWGTHLGMLIQFLFEEFPDWENANENTISDLQGLYRESNKRCDLDPAFKERAQKAVVKLQAKYRKAWSQICATSREELNKVYQRLGVLLEEKGESFYHPYIPRVVEELSYLGIIEESDGARVIPWGKKPLIVVKSNGAYNYGSTELAALWYRINEEKADCILYVTDASQYENHFIKVFQAAKLAGWLPTDDNSYPRATCVAFGHVLGEDGKKFRTRSSEVIRLVELLDEAKARSKAALIERDTDKKWMEDELERTAEAIGYSAVKYADLMNNRHSNYTFNFDRMLNDKGDSAVYLLYAHTRICSIIRKSGKDMEELKRTAEISLDHPDERVLGIYLLQFAEFVEDACTNLMPNILCEYLYNLSHKFTNFYSNCQVKGNPSRLLLCEATGVVMRQCFHLLGIEPVYKLPFSPPVSDGARQQDIISSKGKMPSTLTPSSRDHTRL